MEIIIKCSDDVRGGTNIYGEPIKELVRCKNCKKHKTHRCPMTFDLVATDADDFCSYGEREGE